MKFADIPKEILAAGPCFIGEYRGSIVERVEWVDKNDGKVRGFVKAIHLFEFGAGNAIQAIRVEQPLPKTITDPKEVEVTYKRGLHYLLSLQGLRNERGNIEGRLVAGSVPVAVGA